MLESSAMTSGAGNVLTVLNVANSAQISVQALAAVPQDLNAAMVTIPQRYGAVIAQSQATNAQIAAQQQALYQQLQQLLQSQGTSSQGASQPVTVVVP